MNQICKVCGEPAAGFHFGAFTCEGCKSFFGRSYNNMSNVSECKNNGECIINKKNRTSCKACRLKKCLLVGMSKSGSRYGRRSNWFKIHCLLQEQHAQSQQQPLQHQQQTQVSHLQNGFKTPQRQTPPPTNQQIPFGLLGVQNFPPPLLHLPRTREELMLLGLDEHMNSASPSVSSPESHNSDSSVELNDARRMPLFPGLLPPQFISPSSFLLPPGYPSVYPGLLQPVNHNNNRLLANQNQMEAYKRVYLEAVLQSQRSPRTPTPEELPPKCTELAESPIQETPIDLSIKTSSERGSSPTNSEPSTSRSLATERGAGSEADEEMSEYDSEHEQRTAKVPLDLTRRP